MLNFEADANSLAPMACLIQAPWVGVTWDPRSLLTIYLVLQKRQITQERKYLFLILCEGVKSQENWEGVIDGCGSP